MNNQVVQNNTSNKKNQQNQKHQLNKPNEPNQKLKSYGLSAYSVSKKDNRFFYYSILYCPNGNEYNPFNEKEKFTCFDIRFKILEKIRDDIINYDIMNTINHRINVYRKQGAFWKNYPYFIDFINFIEYNSEQYPYCKNVLPLIKEKKQNSYHEITEPKNGLFYKASKNIYNKIKESIKTGKIKYIDIFTGTNLPRKWLFSKDPEVPLEQINIIYNNILILLNTFVIINSLQKPIIMNKNVFKKALQNAQTNEEKIRIENDYYQNIELKHFISNLQSFKYYIEKIIFTNLFQSKEKNVIFLNCPEGLGVNSVTHHNLSITSGGKRTRSKKKTTKKITKKKTTKK